MNSGSQSLIARLLRHPSGLVGLLLLLLVLGMALGAGYFYPSGPWSLSGSPRLWPGQNPALPLGTDSLGRDLAAGLFHGSRVSLAVGAAAAIFSVAIGTIIGGLSGYYGGWIDDVLMRLTDAMQTIPSFLSAIAIVGIVGPSLVTIIVAIAIVSWPMIARLVRAEFLRLRTYDFVQSCRIIGMSDLRIIFTQILPNCLAPIIVASSVLVATAIIVEASLSFLGLGDPNAMSWGTMLGNGRAALRTAWYMTAIPAAALVLTVLALNLLGDALNDVLNPRLKERS
ncbi:ABC transporter permease [Chelativorans sp. Marseille-P2723]|uniref:ABC transporter permease n=1 Tax=Chelativorans sp. Marseille-P2723 TaxID=2709133 RepID=UPI0015711578|nr:ABC transporter permease [Chelativorans sp. Marseille-P2723]